MTLHDDVRAWIAVDPDADTREALAALLDAGDDATLGQLFNEPLRFGTAGLRGPVAPGPAGMNRLTVRRATQGVAAWLSNQVSGRPRVVVGRDGRHGSETFNDEAVAVLLGAGIEIYEMPRPLPTPLVSFAVKRLKAHAGIMITASHNPAADNGYKLYDHTGAQIVPPTDELVEQGMRTNATPTLGTRRDSHHHFIDESVIGDYLDTIATLFAPDDEPNLRITYSAMHGVGGELALALLTRLGYHVDCVAEQFSPDPTFPTVAFPNPEEAGALDLSFACATRHGSDLILVNDPDADRLSVAVRRSDGWYQLRGDEIGWLLADSLLGEAQPGDVIASSIVSSSLLEKMARDAGVEYRATLTGFKWIARAGVGQHLLFGYEEALGYAVTDEVADKDGVSAAAAFARLALRLHRAGTTVSNRLDELAFRYGLHSVDQLTIRLEGADALPRIRSAVAALRQHPPSSIGGVPVLTVDDLATGWRGLAPTDGLRLDLGRRGRIIIRPSGTEPKLKCYLEVVGEPGTDVATTRDSHQREITDLKRALGDLLSL